VRYNYCVANNSLDGGELERLLKQLLRVMSPPAGGDPEPLPTSSVPGAGQPKPAKEHANANAAASDAAEEGAAGTGAAGNGSGADLPAVSASEARALIELVAARGIAQGELAGLLGLEKSTVSRLASGLERKGWIRRGRDSDNQRYVRLYLTPEGGEVAALVWQAWQSRQERILAALSDEERAGLSFGLRGLVRGLAAEGMLSAAAGHA
jgi:DNA-binding MarR family transcriptional regulator